MVADELRQGFDVEKGVKEATTKLERNKVYSEAWAPDGNPHLLNADGRKAPELRGGTAFHVTGKAAAEQGPGVKLP